jgi:CHAT domain-containing protein
MAATTGGASPITFLVHGQLQAPAAARGARGAGSDGSAGEPVVKASVRVGAARGLGDALRLQAVPDEDVVVLHLAGGPSLTLHPETARDLLLGHGSQQRSRGVADPDTVEVPADMAWQGLADAAPSRGPGLVGQVLLAGIEIIAFGRYSGAAADLAATGAVALADGQVEAGVYSLPDSGPLTALKGSGRRLAQVEPAPGGGPILVLIHGTFVETVSTFGKLWEGHPEAVTTLFARYRRAVYALDHPTLGASPMANALTLVEALPHGARLHLLTHSRGGLVAEVLARLCGQRALGADDLAAFAGTPNTQARAELQALLDAVIERDIHVERVVRVACPARGTLLASRRLDAYLSVFKWTLELAGAPLPAQVLGFLQAVAERRADPTLIPGLAAMVPGSAVVQWLNQPPAGQTIAGDLRVVAGDLKADSIGSFLKTLLADAFYWTDNDVVVHTRSMYGGTPRAGGAHFLLDRSGQASHFTYFRNKLTVDAVLAGLTQSQPEGYQPIGPLSWAGIEADGVRGGKTAGSPGKAATSHRPAVIVVPGLLGSNLQAGGQRIWLGLRLLAGFERLRYQPGGSDGVLPDGPIGLSYHALIDFLGTSHDVRVFDYDWRRPIEEEARRLADLIDAELDARRASCQPVRLIAHSMGGVVARTVQLERPDVWERLMEREGGRLVMLGTPNGGSWAPMQCLTGDDTFGNALTAVGMPFRDHEARQIMAQFPGFLQLQAGLTDPAMALDRQETWLKLAQDDLEQIRARSWWHRNWLQAGEDDQLTIYRWGIPPQEVLDKARLLRQRLDEQRSALRPAFSQGRVLLVVGQSKFTPDGYEVRGGEGFVYLNAVDGGDGRVPLSMAQLPDVPTWQLDCDHGSLPGAKAAFPAFEELLLHGETTRLPRMAAATRGTAPAVMQHERSRPSRAQHPSEPAGHEDSVYSAAAPGAARRADAGFGPALDSPLRITVVNGNLSFISVPLFVGHYESLALTGTERVVDRLIGGTMSTALKLQAGLYPDAVGTHLIFTNNRPDPSHPQRLMRPPAVVVAGLGQEGQLTEARLAATVRQAVLGWLHREAEARSGNPAAAPVEVAATLIGSGGIGMSAGAAGRAIVQGVADANLRVGRSAGGWPPVARLVLVEKFLDRATEAWRELQTMASVQGRRILVDPAVAPGSGPLRRPQDSGYRGAAYDFIRVTTREAGALEFALDSRRARTEVRAQTTQADLVSELVRTAASDTNADEDLGRTLFQLLVPAEIEPYLSGTGRLLLELDVKAAAIPWELLDTPADQRAVDDRPWSLRSGLLRKMQLREPTTLGRADAQAEDAVLVIGEPAVDRPGFGALPGALSEAKAVAEQLQQAGHVGPDRLQALYQAKARPIINALLARRWRIIHIAGHGDPGAPDDATSRGGVVLSGKAFLGPSEIAAMRTVPELVFVNCCHLAAIDPSGTRRDFETGAFAAGVAEQLIRIGVRCVVAAGWAVGDEPAKAFAQAFYGRLLAGANFGAAVAEARDAAHRLGGNTWAAYQCYGDADWVYRTVTGDAQGLSAPLDDAYSGIASPLGLTLALEELAVGSKWEHSPTAGQLAHIGYLEGRHAAHWGGIGAVAEAFGVACHEAGAFDKAIAWYGRALRCNDGSASIKVNEHLGNLLARVALETLREKGSACTPQDVEAARAQVMQALRLLQSLAGVQPTAERFTLIASAWKRLAMIARLAGQADVERSCVQAMDEPLRQAEGLADGPGDAAWRYAALGRLAAAIRLRPLDDAAQALVTDRLQNLQAHLDAQALDAPDFWALAGRIELDLHDQLMRDPDGLRPPDLAARYADLYARAPSCSEWRSVADELDFVLGASPGQPAPGPAIGELLSQLRRYVD